MNVGAFKHLWRSVVVIAISALAIRRICDSYWVDLASKAKSSPDVLFGIIIILLPLSAVTWAIVIYETRGRDAASVTRSAKPKLVVNYIALLMLIIASVVSIAFDINQAIRLAGGKERVFEVNEVAASAVLEAITLYGYVLTTCAICIIKLPMLIAMKK